MYQSISKILSKDWAAESFADTAMLAIDKLESFHNEIYDNIFLAKFLFKFRNLYRDEEGI